MEVTNMFDFQKVLDKANQVKVENENAGNGSGFAHYIEPCMGKTKVRLLYNPKSGEVLRKVQRHWDTVQNTYVPCLKMYGESCPLCDVANEADKAGKGDWKLNPQTKGLAYVQVVHMDEYPEKGLKANDIGLFKFPKTVYDGLNNVLLNAGENVGSLIADPTGYSVIIDRTGKGTDTKYSVMTDPFGKIVTAKTEEEMKTILEGLDDLNEVDFPTAPTDEIRRAVKVAADARRKEYGLATPEVDNPPQP